MSRFTSSTAIFLLASFFLAAPATAEFRGKWWSYYERGMENTEQKKLDDALKDLKKAIGMRDQDQRMARTYGMHFIDYFPHRELGIALLGKGDVDAAIRELELSVRSAESAKAIYYLNAARKAKISGARQAVSAPISISFDKPSQRVITRDRSLKISAAVKSGDFVSRVTINGVSYPVEEAKGKVIVRQEVPLEDDTKEIVITAEDLAGNRTQASLPVTVKREGPVVTITSIASERREQKSFARVLGSVHDSVGIQSVRVGGREVNANGARGYTIDFQVERRGAETLRVRVEDVVGNETVADLDLSQVIAAEAAAQQAESRAEQERLAREAAAREKAAREAAEKERMAKVAAEKERLAKAKAESERIALARAAAEKLALAAEQARQVALAAEREREAAERAALLMAAQKLEQQRKAREQAELERQAKEKAEQQELARRQAEAELKLRQAAEKAEAERVAREEVERQRIAAEKAEQERLAFEAKERARIAAEKAEQERQAQLKAEEERQARIVARKAEEERIAREEAQRIREAAAKAEKERLRLAAEESVRLAREQAEQEALARQAKEAEERGRLVAEQAERDRLAREKVEAEAKALLAAQRAEQERLFREAEERKRLAAVEAEKERQARLVAERLRVAQEKLKQEELAKAKAEEERLLRLAAEKAEAERLAREEAERVKVAAEKAEKERLAREKAEAERVAREKAEREELARQKAEAEAKALLAAEKAEAERKAREEAERRKLAAEKAQQERLAKEAAERTRLARLKLEQEEIARQKAEAERKVRLAAEKAEAERAEREAAERLREAQQKAEQERLAREKAEKAEAARQAYLAGEKQDAEERAESSVEKTAGGRATLVERDKLKAIVDEQKLSLALSTDTDKQITPGNVLSGEGTRVYNPSAEAGSRRPAPAPRVSTCGKPDREKPILNLKDSGEIPFVFVDAYPLDGMATDDCQVDRVVVNGRDLAIRKGKQVYFSNIVKLNSGDNTIKVDVFDPSGNKSSSEFHVTRKIPSVLQNGSRMSVLVLPFDYDQGSTQTIRLASDYLIGAMADQRRFMVVERQKLRKLMEERKLSLAMAEDNDQAAKFGKVASAEAIIVNTARETDHSFEVTSRIVDTETSEVMGVLDVYTEDVSQTSVKTLMTALAAKIARNFPVVEGIVISRDDDQVVTDLGTPQMIRQRTGAIIYRKGKEIKHPVTGKSLGFDTVKLGEGYVDEVQESFSKLKLGDRYRDKSIQTSDLVVTK